MLEHEFCDLARGEARGAHVRDVVVEVVEECFVEHRVVADGDEH